MVVLTVSGKSPRSIAPGEFPQSRVRSRVWQLTERQFDRGIHWEGIDQGEIFLVPH